MVQPISFSSSKPVTNTSQNSNNVRCPKGTLAALAGAAVAQYALPLLPGVPLSMAMTKNLNLKGEEGITVQNAVKQMVKDSKLEDNGVKIRFLNPIKNKKRINVLKSDNPIRAYYDKKHINAVRDGANAFFASKDIKITVAKVSEIKELLKAGEYAKVLQLLKEKKVFIKKNSIILPKEGLQVAGFHEAGHALNAHFSKLGGLLQKSRTPALYAHIALILYGAFSKKSAPKSENGELTVCQKTNNFVRDNAGKLAFLVNLPMLVEEAMASIKGQKYANKLLKPELAKKVLKGNVIAYSTYLLMALCGALAAKLAVRIKDKAVEEKKLKLAET